MNSVAAEKILYMWKILIDSKIEDYVEKLKSDTETDEDIVEYKKCLRLIDKLELFDYAEEGLSERFDAIQEDFLTLQQPNMTIAEVKSSLRKSIAASDALKKPENKSISDALNKLLEEVEKCD
jgi:uncharacterized membrane-anchored protein YjiN (DUF445 family)